MKHLLFLAFILTLIFYFFPVIDHKVVDLTYDSTTGFIWIDQEFFRFVYNSLYIIVPVLVSALIICLIFTIIGRKKEAIIKISYLLICLLVGPGLIVNVILKENLGRARPSQIKEKGKNYSKVFVISDQCNKNCSFTSGHAAFGFYFSAFSYVTDNKKNKYVIILLSIICGLLLGLARILQGAHFLSDIIFSGIIINITNLYIAKFFKSKLKY